MSVKGKIAIILWHSQHSARQIQQPNFGVLVYALDRIQNLVKQQEQISIAKQLRQLLFHHYLMIAPTKGGWGPTGAWPCTAWPNHVCHPAALGPALHSQDLQHHLRPKLGVFQTGCSPQACSSPVLPHLSAQAQQREKGQCTFSFWAFTRESGSLSNQLLLS